MAQGPVRGAGSDRGLPLHDRPSQPRGGQDPGRQRRTAPQGLVQVHPEHDRPRHGRRLREQRHEVAALWASYRIMWGHGLLTQYSVRTLLPRMFMAAVLINFAMPLLQMVVSATNAISHTVQTLAVTDDLTTLVAGLKRGDPGTGTWEIVTTGALAGGYGVLAIAYLVRYAVLIVLAVTAPLAALFFMLPETQHLAKMWTTHFTSNLLMQPAQLFVLSA